MSGSTAIYADALPAREPIDRVPRIAVLTGAVNQDVWSLRNLAFACRPDLHQHAQHGGRRTRS